MKKNLLKGFLVFMIVIISLNMIFAATVEKKYMIVGDLTITPKLRNACLNGGDWENGTEATEEDTVVQNLSSNSLLKLFFDAGPEVYPSSCSLEIYSPNSSTLIIFEKRNINAEAIKAGLKEGIMTNAIKVNASQPVLNFTVKIRHYQTNSVLLETVITVPNINSGTKINADGIIAPILDTNYNLSNGAAPVLMMTMEGTRMVPKWKRIDTFNIASGGAIPQEDLGILDRNMTEKHGWVLSWDSDSGKMKWNNEITTDLIKDGTLLSRDFHPNATFAEIGGRVVAPTTAPTFVTGGSTNYLVFDVNGSTYYVELKKLVGAPSSIELGNNETSFINTNITKVAEVTSVTNLNWAVPAGVQLISGQGTNTAVLRGTGYGNKTVTLSGVSTNNGATVTDTFSLNVVDQAIVNAGADVEDATSPYKITKIPQLSGVSNVTWATVPYSGSVTIDPIPAGSAGYGTGKVITASAPGQYTIKISGVSNFSENTISDTFVFTAFSGGTGGGGSGPSNPCFCFKAGTLIDTIDGKKAIESLKEGDKVYSYDLDNKKLVLSTINKMLIHNGNPNKSLKVTLIDGTELYVTDNHPIYSVNSKDYKPIGEFTINDRLINRKGDVTEILKIEQVADFGTTYNFSLDGELRNYFANGILVHNKDATDLCSGAETNPTQGGCYQTDEYGNTWWYNGNCP